MLIQIALPVAVMVLPALVFLAAAVRTHRASPSRYARARRLSGTARDVVLGSVGKDEPFSPDVSHGMAVREVDGRITIARTGRLTRDAVRSL